MRNIKKNNDALNMIKCNGTKSFFYLVKLTAAIFTKNNYTNVVM